VYVGEIIKTLSTTGKLGGCYFSLGVIFKIRATLDFKNKRLRFSKTTA
jgi:hypothetical protein